MAGLAGFHVAVLATDGFEETELTEPVRAFRDAGATVDILSLHSGQIQAFRHHDKSIKVAVTKTLAQAKADQYDALHLPGGALNADALRVVPEAKDFVRRMFEAGKPVGVICHAPWLLVSAGLAKGKRLTSYHTIKDDLVNAGAEWKDEEVVEDGNLVTSRKPDDIPAFNKTLLKLCARFAGEKSKAA